MTIVRVPPPAPGVYRSTPFVTYTSWDAASNTLLGKLERSAAHARAYLDGLDEDTEAKRLGRPIHCAVFEPDKLETRYRLAPQCAVLTDKGRGPQCTNTASHQDDQRGWVCGTHGKGRDDHRVSAVGEVIDAADLATCTGIRDGVRRSRSASLILAAPAECELSIVWVDPDTGVTVKARLDVHNPEFADGTIGDGKSCEDARRPAFTRSIFNFGYYRQAALYVAGARILGLPAQHFAFIALEKKHPYLVKVHRIMDDLVAKGAEENRALLEQYAHCRATDEWPGYDDEISDIGVDGWAWTRIDDRIHEISQRSAA